MLDIVVQNGLLADGGGGTPYITDVGIKDGRINAIGKLSHEEAARRIEADGLIVCPGFIDAHCHLEVLPFLGDTLEDRLYQGVTTIVGGQCGEGLFPLLKEKNAGYCETLGLNGVTLPWSDFSSFAEYTQSMRPFVNIASLAGHGPLRYMVTGMEARPAAEDEIRRMCEQLDAALAEGAAGFSTGLIFPPAMYSNADELKELASVAKRHGKPFAVHMRNESDHIVQAVREVLDIALSSGVRLQISHHKVTGKYNWGKIKQTLALIEDAKNKGVDVSVDCYPYTSGSNNFTAILPPDIVNSTGEQLKVLLSDRHTRASVRQRMENDHSYENFFIQAENGRLYYLLDVPASPEFNGKTLSEIADIWGMDTIDAAFRLIIENGHAAVAATMTISEDDLQLVLSKPYTAIGSDSFPKSPGALTHPRYNGTFVRVLYKYCMQEKLFTVQEAIRRMTQLPAQIYGLTGRGYITQGAAADVTVFDPHGLSDRADIASPNSRSEGIRYVMVNGEVKLDNGKPTGKGNGSVLRI